MKAIDRNLYSRNGHLYYRAAVPRFLQPLLPFRETVVALRTMDWREARAIVARLHCCCLDILT